MRNDLFHDDFALTAQNESQFLLSKDFITRIGSLDLVSRKILQGKLKGERRSRRRGQSVEFDDYRQYVAGDDLRFLDWNIYGRLNRLFIKLFLEDEDLHLAILIDCSASMDYGSPNKFRYAQRVAAALGYIGLANYSRVSIAGFHSKLAANFQPARGRQSVHKMFHFIAGLQPGGETDLNQAIRLFSLQNKNRGLVILISDFMDRNGYESAMNSLLARKNEVFCLHLMSEQELNPPLAGDLKLLDMELGEATELTISRPLLASYQKVLKSFVAQLRESCTKRGVNYLSSSTSVPFEKLVLGYLRERGLVR